MLRAALGELRETRFYVVLTFILGMMAETLAAAGDRAEASAALEEGLARGDTLEERWFAPELLRIRGQVAILEGAHTAAEAHFESALALAGSQGALSWELRAATQLATLRSRMGRAEEGRVVLEPIYRRFTEGFDLPDLVAAKAVLDAHAR